MNSIYTSVQDSAGKCKVLHAVEIVLQSAKCSCKIYSVARTSMQDSCKI